MDFHSLVKFNKYVTCNVLAVWVSSVWYRIRYYMNLTSRGYVLVKFGQVISLADKEFWAF